MAIENALKTIKVLDQATNEIAKLIRNSHFKLGDAVKDRLDQVQQLLFKLKDDIEAKEVKAPLF